MAKFLSNTKHAFYYRFHSCGVLILAFVFLSVAQDMESPDSDSLSKSYAISDEYRKKVENWYYQGEFEEATESLEYLIRSKKLKTKDDSIFVFKYLGIIYASDIETETKGENYLYRMLTISPDANVSDMRLSEYLESLFYRVSYRFYQNQLDENKIQTKSEPKPEPQKKSPPPKKEKEGVPSWVWYAGAGAAAVVGTLSWYFWSNSEKPDPPSVTTGEL